MREGKELILATKDFANDFKSTSWWCILSTMFLLVIALSGTIWNINLAAKFLSSLLAGLLMVRLFVIYHDHQHKAILLDSPFAAVLMKTYGLIAITPSSIWNSSHNYHHTHNSKLKSAHIGSYPIMTKEQFLSISKNERRQYLFMRHPMTIAFGYLFVFLIGMCITPVFRDPKRHFDSVIALVIHLALNAAILYYLGWLALLLTITIPFFIASAIGSYLFYAQHNFPGVTFKDNDGWTYVGAAMESSSFLDTNKIMHWFTANIGYHHIHHVNSRIPFYRLPEAMREVPELQNVKTTTLSPLDILRCLRLKIWDVEANKMVALSEI